MYRSADKCKGITCDFHAKCESGSCVCPIVCPEEKEPVCGTDQRTYKNECEMRKSACVNSKDIQVAFMGQCSGDSLPEGSGDGCDDEDSEACTSGDGEIIVDGDKETMTTMKPTERPPCTVKNCMNFGGECSLRGVDYVCQCNFKCGSEKNLVCGSDGRMYHSECDMSLAACMKKDLIMKQPLENCDDVCHCNSIGSYSNTCDPKTRQCTCKPGVGGKRCERCEIGYWAMNKIAELGNSGCIPCNCNKFGSDRDDCDQNTGRCECKPFVRGMKCDTCPDGDPPGPSGCRERTSWPMTCADLGCPEWATCQEGHHGLPPTCDCHLDCETARPQHGSGSPQDVVCGTDGQTYGSECQLKLFSCRQGNSIAMAHKGPCRGSLPTPATTMSPVTRSRKTTRHTDGMTDPRSETSPNGQGPQPNEEGEKQCRRRKIGQICVKDVDCCPENSFCSGVCECEEGYVPDLDNTRCFEVKEVKPETQNVTDACTNNPCHAGTCVLDKLLGYRCACPLGKVGVLCNSDVIFSEPSFSGRSHLELPRLEGSFKRLSIELTFTTLNDDGIILFNAKHKNGSGDFVSLSIKNGFLEFRYDLGGGPAILRSQVPVERTVMHRVIAHQDKYLGSLVLDNEPEVTGSSPPSHESLELHDPLFLGHVPNGTRETYARIGVSVGLNGCIKSLRAGESRSSMRTYNLALNSIFSDLQAGVDVGLQCDTLENPCATEPCYHGGTCVPMVRTNTFFCQCPEGREGLRCERESIPEVYVPQFSGDSYLEMPLEENLSDSLKITIWFLAQKPDGVLMFTTQNPGGGGDFIALNLVNKKLVFSFFLGSGLGVIESKKHIHLDKWHEVTINRTSKIGEMTINDHPPVTGEAKGISSELNVDNRPLFLGGFRSLEDVPKRAEIKKGFTGAIQRLTINGRTVDGLMSNALTMRNISTYNGPPCNVNPCMNGGVCVPMLNQAECRCPSNYMGKRCQKRFEQMDLNQPIQFDGMSFISYPNAINSKQEGQKSNIFYIRFRAHQPDGILMLQAGGDTVGSDYLLLALDSGHVIFSYNLGGQRVGQLFIIRSNVNVMDDDWHIVRVIRRKREGTLQVDDEDPVVSVSESGTQQLDTDGLLWLGGRNNVPFGLPITQNLYGCISEVQINGQSLHLVKDKMPDTMSESTAFTFCAENDA
ncbi:agrin [Plakobranchus ocellatus]|uniref:Agrin n=1 Tax=Plakobranchus ocellatus TaxID=259542 RepID=A0AAV4BBK5_9GAST|nr:agrin [Plakobranchus ocellatus]